MSEAGRLVVVATPIGNLGDLSKRAIETLAAADVVACEDTRHTGLLLNAAGIRARRLLSLHGHNEAARVGQLLDELAAGATIALVCDAGTPLVSDPGARLVAAAGEAGYLVTAVPGPSALLAALVVSGLPTERFRFEGFLPRKGPERRARLSAIAAAGESSICYEAPSRVAATLADLAEACGGERPAAVCRELTKLHEEVWRGTLAGAAAWAGSREPRGEYVVVVAGRGADAPPEGAAVDELVSRLLAAGLSRRDAATAAALVSGGSRRGAYDAANRVAASPPPAEEHFEGTI